MIRRGTICVVNSGRECNLVRVPCTMDLTFKPWHSILITWFCRRFVSVVFCSITCYAGFWILAGARIGRLAALVCAPKHGVNVRFPRLCTPVLVSRTSFSLSLQHLTQHSSTSISTQECHFSNPLPSDSTRNTERLTLVARGRLRVVPKEERAPRFLCPLTLF